MATYCWSRCAGRWQSVLVTRAKVARAARTSLREEVSLTRDAPSRRTTESVLTVDLIAATFLILAAVCTFWGVRIYADNTAVPVLSDNAYRSDAAVFLRGAPAGIETDIFADVSNAFSSDNESIQYKIDLHGTGASVGKKVLVSLVLTRGSGKAPKAFYMSADDQGDMVYDANSHSRVMRFKRVYSSSDVTTDDQQNPGEGLESQVVEATVMQKYVTVTSPTTATGLGNPGAPDSLFVTETPGVIGAAAAGRYEAALPEIGGDRDRMTASNGTESRLIDNDGALYPVRGQALGSSPAKQDLDVLLAALPAGVQVTQSAPERKYNQNNLEWETTGDAAQTPLAVRLELTRASGIQAAVSWTFWAGIVIALGVSALLYVIDRVFRDEVLRLLPPRSLPRR